MADGITSAQVRAWLKIADGDDVDLIDQVTAAANVWCARVPLAVAADSAGNPWPADVVNGAIQYAALLYRNRLSPQGTDSAGNIIYPARRNPEIDRLLGLARPRVG